MTPPATGARSVERLSHAYVGTSGWNYPGWGEAFYGGLRPRDWLRFCAARFTAIEVNATFYRLQSRDTFRRWRDQTPPEFRFAIKANRYLTHNKKLNDPLPAIRIERERASALGARLAAVAWQLPRNFHRNLDVTTDLVYVRLHGHEATYASYYPDSALRAWAAKLRRWLREGREVHVYFDNDASGHAPRDALRLLALLG